MPCRPTYALTCALPKTWSWISDFIECLFIYPMLFPRIYSVFSDVI